jgi:hypothetical protein
MPELYDVSQIVSRNAGHGVLAVRAEMIFAINSGEQPTAFASFAYVQSSR